MSHPINQPFGRRLFALAIIVVIAAGFLIYWARRASSAGQAQLVVVARTELEADTLARAFRDRLDRLQGVFLETSSPGSVELREAVDEARDELTAWIRKRQSGNQSDAEHALLAQLAHRLDEHFTQIETHVLPPLLEGASLELATFGSLQMRTNQLQGLADDFARSHIVGLKAMLQGTFDDLEQLRNLVYACLVLLGTALVALGVLIYRMLIVPLRMMVVDRDEALAHSEKLAALGTLAAGVAHEIRNPLTAMKARLYTLRRTVVNDAVLTDLDSIQRDADRLEKIVRDVLGYARTPIPRYERFDLAEWLHELVVALRPEMVAAKIALLLKPGDPLALEADPDQLRQVVLNLARNSREALEGRAGSITLTWHEGTWNFRFGPEPGVVLVLEDDGPGIPADVRPRLFDPFFTTKASGTGLGLAIVARITDAHRGSIAYETAPGHGTRFEIRLQLRQRPAHRTMS
jgi:signal transduction histidine kinase